MAKIVWFHFSDLHYRSSDDFNRDRVLNALWTDISKQISEGSLPHFITVTGDIAFSGQAEEYRRAENEFFLPLLERTGVSHQNVFFVPGNHDFDRSYLDILNKNAIRQLTNRDSINRFIEDNTRLEMYLQPFKGYADFVGRFTDNSNRVHSPEFGYCTNASFSGVPFSIVGLNSAWTCNYFDRSDKGMLLLGERQIVSAFDARSPDSIRVTLIHHPIDWFAESEVAALKHELYGDSSFLQHGHVHLSTEISHHYTPDHKCFVLGAAACYDRRVGTDLYANGYSIISLDTSERKVTLRLRKYSDVVKPHWTSNEDVMGEGTAGAHTFPVPSEWFGEGPQDLGANADTRSLDDIYRLSNTITSRLPDIYREFNSWELTAKQSAQLLRFEELVCSYVNVWRSDWSVGMVERVATSVLVAETIMRCQGTVSKQFWCEWAADSLGVLEPFFDADDQQIQLAARVWETICEGFHQPPHSLVQELAEKVSPHQTSIALLSLSIVLLADGAAARCLLDLPSFEGVDKSGSLPIPARARMISESVAGFTTTASGSDQFMALTLVRFNLEQRIEQVTEVYATADIEFPLQALRLTFLEQSRMWRENRFSVDTNRIISLLMGKELYGERSRDVWFREVLQNAVDACHARQRVDSSYKEQRVQIRFSKSDRRVRIQDNGVGMSRWQIDRFFCRVGRSFWRSEELAQYFEDEKIENVSIGRFGIGFLSVFDVASRVEVRTRFCQEEEGHFLRISSVREPFFIRDANDVPMGTEITIQFEDSYEPTLEEIAKKYLVYLPKGVKVTGIPNIPSDSRDALKAEIKRDSEKVEWYTDSIRIEELRAELHIAVPMSSSKTEGRYNSDLPRSTGVRVSNGGIAVYETEGDWIGKKQEYGRGPSSGVNGITAILDFDSGTAPVTVSRNEIRVSKSESELVLQKMQELTSDIWRKHATKLFKRYKQRPTATRKLIQALNNSADRYGDSYYSRREPSWWCKSDVLNERARQLLIDNATVEVFENGNLSTRRLVPLSELVHAESSLPRVVTVKKRMEEPLFRLYCKQTPKLEVIAAPDVRTVILFAECHSEWTKLVTDEELWAVIEIKETTDAELCHVIPAEGALVSTKYFTKPSTLAVVLPRRRARADAVLGLHRSDATNVPARVLINFEHRVTKKLEAGLKDASIAAEKVDDLFQLLFAQVVNEKAKSRRSREFQSLRARLLKLCGLSSNTKVEIDF